MILQSHVPYPVAPAPRLPGVAPFDLENWLHVDDAYTGQMAQRERLLNTTRDRVLAELPEARPAASELFDTILAQLPDSFERTGDTVRCPDGRIVDLDRKDPLDTLGRLIQEDLCLMEQRGDAHVLTGAVLCFPASWLLSEKIGRPLLGIHEPVEEYDEGLARRVQRLFDGVQVGRPLWRFNALYYADATLFQPRSEHARRTPVDKSTAPYLRSERQCLVRLPESRAVVFSIHTYVVPRNAAEALDTSG